MQFKYTMYVRYNIAVLSLWQEALQSLASDPGLHQMLPRFSTFISEGVCADYFIKGY